MANGVSASFEGFDEVLRTFEKAPQEGMKVARKCMRKGVQACNRQVKSRVPARWKNLSKCSVDKSKGGNFYGKFGLFNGHQRQGHQNAAGDVDDWFKAYWLNYGTLEGRDPNHTFQKPVKHAKTAAANRRKGTYGVKHRNFYETAIEGFEDTFSAAFEQELDRNIKEIFK